MNGIVDASVFTSQGGYLHQVSESFDVTGNTVTLTIGRAIAAAALPDYGIKGYLEVNGAREQSYVPVQIISS